MPLQPGDRLGHYRILAPLGAGGMGEVYRAYDTQLERDVAIKVLPRALAGDVEHLARFDREAKMLAALNHPNIAILYGLVECDFGRALAMELVPGETLGDHIKRGSLPIQEALQVARQIAEALEAAHEKGIVHRDLKPGNVMITPTGVVKVLDFGLAGMTQAAPSTPRGLDTSPTLTIGMTQAGAIMGTAAYMAPEQAAGAPVDRRADIWAFGVVLWEMLSGQRLFNGDSVAHVLADVLRAPIDFGQVTAPQPVRTLLRRCLDRDLKNRLQWIGEGRIAISTYLADPDGGTEVVPQVGSLPHRHNKAAVAVAALAVAGATALATIHFREPGLQGPPTLRFAVPMPPKTTLGNTLAISPDGRQLVFRAKTDGETHLWIHSLDSLGSRMLPGNRDLMVLPLDGGTPGKPSVYMNGEGAESLSQFSPDGRFVAYLISQSGRTDVYVSTFPDPTAGRWAISSGHGGYQPRWNRNGKELLYFTGDGKLMSVDVSLSPAFKAGPPKELFSAPIYGGGATANQIRWDIHPNGQKFLLNTTSETTVPLTVVLNWQPSK